jgi:hypothetical protein
MSLVLQRLATVSIVGAALSNLVVSGISTLGTVKISSGIVTASSGIVTYYGDGQYLDLRNNPSTRYWYWNHWWTCWFWYYFP